MADQDKIDIKDVTGDVTGTYNPNTFKASDDRFNPGNRIYVRAQTGYWQRVRKAMGWFFVVLFVAIPWLRYDGRQAVLFDIGHQQFHIFGATIWPQDLTLLAWIFMIAAFGLFFVTTFLGRVWCGYLCPQTVWTFMFIWFEEKLEGAANKRRKLDASPWNAEKLARKGPSIWPGSCCRWVPASPSSPTSRMCSSWCRTSSPCRPVAGSSSGWCCSPPVPTATPAGCAPSCAFTCARMLASSPPCSTRTPSSSAMTPSAVRPVVPVPARPIPRRWGWGLHRLRPLRAGLPDRHRHPRRPAIRVHQLRCLRRCLRSDHGADGLSEGAHQLHYRAQAGQRLHPRGAAQADWLWPGDGGDAGVFVYNAMSIMPMGLDILRDRNQLFRENSEGLIENTYTLKILNKTLHPQTYQLDVEGLPEHEWFGPREVTLKAGEIFTLPVSVAVDPFNLKKPTLDIRFVLKREGARRRQQGSCASPASSSAGCDRRHHGRF